MNRDDGTRRWRSPLRFLARPLLGPLRRFFDPRLIRVQTALAAHMSAEAKDTREHLTAVARDVAREQADWLTDMRRFVVSSRDTDIDAATFIGEALRDLDERLADVQEAVAQQVPSTDELNEASAELLNRAVGHEGFAAQHGLWFNWPLAITYGPDEVQVANVNERVVEMPYAFRALAALDAQARILDVGAAESTLALSLASLGCQVVALDPRGYPLRHENLRTVDLQLEAWETDERFDAVTCISTIEHIGAGEYGESRQRSGADARALERIRELTVPGGLLVLTAPLGGSGYERARLDELLAGWQIEDFSVVERRSATAWTPGEGSSSTAAVALVTARRR